MLAFERREQILNTLYKEKKVFVSALAESFDVTEETIRRDLEKMEREGIVTRTYGGATLNIHTNEDLPYQTRGTINMEEKKAIARHVSEFINDSDTLMADTSSTAFEALRELAVQKNHLTVITNSVIALQEFSQNQFHLISTGGSLRAKSRSLVGPLSHEALKRYHVDTAILSCKGLSRQKGITDSNDPEADLKKIMLEQANKVILLADHTKFDEVALVKITDFHLIDVLITDQKPSDEWLTFLEEQQITVIF
ncbi:DeoR/GlpR family DNA-binding transcription regulator [Listeria costaricensis]|uniref:DeoR/GlpR family DNA-binding transcription regulator n=1 Tax=Listeria costaricensis TaxID=2026604 RepID=UPI000C08D7EB|nr:DeoR/GlpR family DNA-binding transcription regulator [Listeria costaricensis]